MKKETKVRRTYLCVCTGGLWDWRWRVLLCVWWLQAADLVQRSQ